MEPYYIPVRNHWPLLPFKKGGQVYQQGNRKKLGIVKFLSFSHVIVQWSEGRCTIYRRDTFEIYPL